MTKTVIAALPCKNKVTSHQHVSGQSYHKSELTFFSLRLENLDGVRRYVLSNKDTGLETNNVNIWQYVDRFCIKLE